MCMLVSCCFLKEFWEGAIFIKPVPNAVQFKCLLNDLIHTSLYHDNAYQTVPNVYHTYSVFVHAVGFCCHVQGVCLPFAAFDSEVGVAGCQSPFLLWVISFDQCLHTGAHSMLPNCWQPAMLIGEMGVVWWYNWAPWLSCNWWTS